jgi:hypothetical protein
MESKVSSLCSMELGAPSGHCEEEKNNLLPDYLGHPAGGLVAIPTELSLRGIFDRNFVRISHVSHARYMS